MEKGEKDETKSSSMFGIQDMTALLGGGLSERILSTKTQSQQFVPNGKGNQVALASNVKNSSSNNIGDLTVAETAALLSNEQKKKVEHFKQQQQSKTKRLRAQQYQDGDHRTINSIAANIEHLGQGKGKNYQNLLWEEHQRREQTNLQRKNQQQIREQKEYNSDAGNNQDHESDSENSRGRRRIRRSEDDSLVDVAESIDAFDKKWHRREARQKVVPVILNSNEQLHDDMIQRKQRMKRHGSSRGSRSSDDDSSNDDTSSSSSGRLHTKRKRQHHKTSNHSRPGRGRTSENGAATSSSSNSSDDENSETDKRRQRLLLLRQQRRPVQPTIIDSRANDPSNGSSPKQEPTGVETTVKDKSDSHDSQMLRRRRSDSTSGSSTSYSRTKTRKISKQADLRENKIQNPNSNVPDSSSTTSSADSATSTSGSSTEDDDDSEDEVVRPVIQFVPKGKRTGLVKSAHQLEEEVLEREAKEKEKIEERKRQSRVMLQQTIIQEENNISAKNLDSSYLFEGISAATLTSNLIPDDTDYPYLGDQDDAKIANDQEDRKDLSRNAYDEWIIRELERILNDYDEELDRFQLQKEKEARRRMTDEEIMREIDQKKQGSKSKEADPEKKVVGAQRYHHRGAFYMDDEEWETNDIRHKSHQYSQAATRKDYEIMASKQLLPEVMQVKKFGFANQNLKYKGIRNEDTTDYKSDMLPLTNKKIAGTKKSGHSDYDKRTRF